MMECAWVDCKTVKQTVSMEVAVACYGVMLRRVNRTYLRGRCPLPTYHSKSSNQTFIVNTDKNAWACHSDSCAGARGGRIGGNVLDFVAAMEKCSIRQAALRLQEWFIVSTAPKAPTPARPQDVPPTTDISWAVGSSIGLRSNKPLPFTLQGIDYSHPYLGERGIMKETAKHFGIGFFPGKGCMQGCIVIPIHNDDGILVAYAGRALGESEAKYKFPVLFRKSLMLFNLHRAAKHGRTVVVVEAFSIASKCIKPGYPASWH
jgi:DNA primase